MRKKELGETSKKRRTDFRFLCATQPSHGESINSAATVAHVYTYRHTHACLLQTLYPDWSHDLSLFCPICSSVSAYLYIIPSSCVLCTRSRVCEGGIIGIMLRWLSKGCEGGIERESRTSSYRSATPLVPSPSF